MSTERLEDHRSREVRRGGAERDHRSEASCCGDTCCGGRLRLRHRGLRSPPTCTRRPRRRSCPKEAVLASLGCGNPTALAELREGEVVLDLGSGGGIDVLLSARRVGPTGKAYGLDMTDEMLELARENQRKAGVENVEFLRGEIEAIPLPDSSVDVIISNCVVNLSGDKRKVIAEAFRVLKPGGRFAVSDVVVRGEMPAQVRQSMELWVGCVAGALTEGEFRDLPRGGRLRADRHRADPHLRVRGRAGVPGRSRLRLRGPGARGGRLRDGRLRPRPEAVTTTIRVAAPGDFAGVVRLLEAADLPTAGLEPSLPDFLVAEESGRVVGAVGLEVYGDCALLRSAVVDAGTARLGIGDRPGREPPAARRDAGRARDLPAHHHGGALLPAVRVRPDSPRRRRAAPYGRPRSSAAPARIPRSRCAR